MSQTAYQCCSQPSGKGIRYLTGCGRETAWPLGCTGQAPLCCEAPRILAPRPPNKDKCPGSVGAVPNRVGGLLRHYHPPELRIATIAGRRASILSKFCVCALLNTLWPGDSRVCHGPSCLVVFQPSYVIPELTVNNGTGFS